MKVGDIIKVFCYGGDYTTYEAWAEKYKLKKWISGDNTNENSFYSIVVIAPHSRNKQTIFGIKDVKTKQEYIVDEKYIKFVRKREMQLELNF